MGERRVHAGAAGSQEGSKVLRMSGSRLEVVKGERGEGGVRAGGQVAEG